MILAEYISEFVNRADMDFVANTACDRHNFILNYVVGPGNIHDGVMF